MRQTKIPMVRAAFKKQFEVAMRANNVFPDMYFDKVGLPTEDNYDPESLLPEKPFWKLINLVASNENIVDFGIQAAKLTPWHKVNTLLPLIQESQNLEELLLLFSEAAFEQSNTSRFLLEKNTPYAIFTSATETLFEGDRQMELYRVTCMIQLIQLAAGSAWFPSQIDMQMSEFKVILRHPQFKYSQIAFAQPQTRIFVPDILLKLPVNLEISTTISGLNQYDINADFYSTIQQLIGIYAATRECKIEMIAEVAGLSVRSLQRRLKEKELTFRGMLNNARHELALLMLKNTTLPITRIATNLGYTDAAHFTRAFRGWSNVSPREFRTHFLK